MQAWTFERSFQDRKFLSQRKVLSRELRTRNQDRPSNKVGDTPKRNLVLTLGDAPE